MLTVANLADAAGQWIMDDVRLLTAPKADEHGRYTALAQVGDALAVVAVRLTLMDANGAVIGEVRPVTADRA